MDYVKYDSILQNALILTGPSFRYPRERRQGGEPNYEKSVKEFRNSKFSSDPIGRCNPQGAKGLL